MPYSIGAVDKDRLYPCFHVQPAWNMSKFRRIRPRRFRFPRNPSRHLAVKRATVTLANGAAFERGLRYPIVMELIFEIRDAEEGGFCARALGHAIFTEADTWEALRTNVLEAVSLHFEDAPARPSLVQMHYVKDELIPLEAA